MTLLEILAVSLAVNFVLSIAMMFMSFRKPHAPIQKVLADLASAKEAVVVAQEAIMVVKEQVQLELDLLNESSLRSEAVEVK